jgi:hypothetical protein
MNSVAINIQRGNAAIMMNALTQHWYGQCPHVVRGDLPAGDGLDGRVHTAMDKSKVILTLWNSIMRTRRDQTTTDPY